MPLKDTERAWLIRFSNGGVQVPDGDRFRLPLSLQLELSNAEERKHLASERSYWTDWVDDKVGGFESKLAALREEKVEVKRDGKVVVVDVVSVASDLDAWDPSSEHVAEDLEAWDKAETELAKLSSDQQGLLSSCEDQMNGLAGVLSEKTYPWSVLRSEDIAQQHPPPPVFTDAEVGEVVFGPRVRSVLYPEGLVPDRYSAVAQRIRASLDLYTQDETLALDTARDLAEGAEKIGKLLSALADTTAATSVVAGLDAETVGLVKGVTTGIVDLAVTVTKCASDLRNGDHANELGATVGAAFRSGWAVAGGEEASAVCDLVELGSKAAGRLAKGVLDTTSANTPEARAAAVWDTVVGEISAGLELGFSSADEPTRSEIKLVSAAIRGTFSTDGAGGTLVKAIRSGDGSDWYAFADQLGRDVAVLLNTAFANLTEQRAVRSWKQDPSLPPAKQSRLYTWWKKQDPKPGGSWEAFYAHAAAEIGNPETVYADYLDEEIEATRAAMTEATEVGGEALKRRDLSFSEREQSFEEYLAGSGGVRAVQLAMARTQQQRLTLKLITNVMKSGATGASKFFPAAAAAGTLAKLIEVGAQLGEDVALLVKLQRGSALAEHANSPFGGVVKAFLREQERLVNQDAVKLLATFVKFGAQLVQSSEPLTLAVGKVVAASASLVEASRDVIDWAVDKQQARAAWEVTKAALDDPTNRRLNARAQAQNGTLGKYALAYGAVVQRDPVAREIVAGVGDFSAEDLITAQSRQDELCQALFGYLNARYHRHVKVLHRLDGTDEPDETWAAGISLSTEGATWARLSRTLEERGIKVSVRAVVDLLSRFERGRTHGRAEVDKLLSELVSSDVAPQALEEQERRMVSLKAELMAFEAVSAQLEAALARVGNEVLVACKTHPENHQAAKRIRDQIHVLQEDVGIAADLTRDHLALLDRRIDVLSAGRTEQALAELLGKRELMEEEIRRLSDA